MYLAALLTALVAGALAVEPVLPNNDWIHLLGKKNTLDTLLKPIDWSILQPLLLSKKRDILQRSSTSFQPLDLTSILFPGGSGGLTLQQLLDQSASKRNLQSIQPIDWSIVQPLLLSKKRNILQRSSTSAKPLDLTSLLFPGVSGGLTIQQLLDQSASRRNLQSIQPIDWSILQPLLLSKKRDVLQDSSTTFNPSDLGSVVSPLLGGGLTDLTPQQLLALIASKRSLQSILTIPDLGIIPFNPNLINSKKRDILAPGGSGVFSIQDLINQISSKRNLQSIQPIDWSILQPLLLSKKRDIIDLGGSGSSLHDLIYVISSKRSLQSIQPIDWSILQPLLLSKKRDIINLGGSGGSSLQDLINQISSKSNLQSILTIPDLGIIPFNPNLILSKKRDVVFDPFNTNPLIISKKRDILFDPLHPNVISKKNIWNPLIDILLPPIKDVV